jgi:hypothetical protein
LHGVNRDVSRRCKTGPTRRPWSPSYGNRRRDSLPIESSRDPIRVYPLSSTWLENLGLDGVYYLRADPRDASLAL